MNVTEMQSESAQCEMMDNFGGYWKMVPMEICDKMAVKIEASGLIDKSKLLTEFHMKFLDKSKQNSAVLGSSSASWDVGTANATVSNSKSSMRRDGMVLDERLWSTLPEEIQGMVVERVPYPAQCRFRCVCRKWKGFQSLLPPPPCSIIVDRAGNRNEQFYCDAERVWFSHQFCKNLPLPLSYRSWTWELVDVDGGLACYLSNQSNKSNLWFWFCVCNPLYPSSWQLIEFKYLLMHKHAWSIPKNPKSKLLVNRENNAFMIVALLDDLPKMTEGRFDEHAPWPAVYRSTLSSWTIHRTSPGFHGPSCRLPDFYMPPQYFVWRNIVYAYLPGQKSHMSDPMMCQLNLQKGHWPWIRFDAELPFEFRFPTKRLFVSNKNQLMLVLYSYRKRPRPYFSIWKLLDEGSRFLQNPSRVAGPRVVGNQFLLKREMWEKVEMRSLKDTVDLAGHNFAGATYDGEQISLAFKNGLVKGWHFYGPRYGSVAYKFVRYSFTTNSWSLMASPGDLSHCLELYSWEPSPGAEIYSWEPSPAADWLSNSQRILPWKGCLIY